MSDLTAAAKVTQTLFHPQKSQEDSMYRCKGNFRMRNLFFLSVCVYVCVPVAHPAVKKEYLMTMYNMREIL